MSAYLCVPRDILVDIRYTTLPVSQQMAIIRFLDLWSEPFGDDQPRYAEGNLLRLTALQVRRALRIRERSWIAILQVLRAIGGLEESEAGFERSGRLAIPETQKDLRQQWAARKQRQREQREETYSQVCHANVTPMSREMSREIDEMSRECHADPPRARIDIDSNRIDESNRSIDDSNLYIKESNRFDSIESIDESNRSKGDDPGIFVLSGMQQYGIPMARAEELMQKHGVDRCRDVVRSMPAWNAKTPIRNPAAMIERALKDGPGKYPAAAPPETHVSAQKIMPLLHSSPANAARPPSEMPLIADLLPRRSGTDPVSPPAMFADLRSMLKETKEDAPTRPARPRVDALPEPATGRSAEEQLRVEALRRQAAHQAQQEMARAEKSA